MRLLKNLDSCWTSGYGREMNAELEAAGINVLRVKRHRLKVYKLTVRECRSRGVNPEHPYWVYNPKNYDTSFSFSERECLAAWRKYLRERGK